MDFIGKWKNQYGSILEIISDVNHKITGKFKTGLEDSGFYGKEIEMIGFRKGNCVGIAGGCRTALGDMLVTYTGLLRNGKLQTLWYVVTDASLMADGEGKQAYIKENNWWKAMSTSADTFERIK